METDLHFMEHALTALSLPHRGSQVLGFIGTHQRAQFFTSALMGGAAGVWVLQTARGGLRHPSSW